MLLSDILPLVDAGESHALTITCLVSQVVDEARRRGLPDMANRLEDCFVDLLAQLPKQEKATALMFSYATLVSDGESARRPQLRLVHSRD
jgi:hypothetical protein